MIELDRYISAVKSDMNVNAQMRTEIDRLNESETDRDLNKCGRFLKDKYLIKCMAPMSLSMYMYCYSSVVL